MLHVFPRIFTLPQQRGERAALASVTTPLTPATYIRLRREAAGLTVNDVAVMLGAVGVDTPTATDLVNALETPGNIARRDQTLEIMRGAFAFDPDVYRQLAAEPADRHPRICRGCGCSQWDPCDDADRGACAWATDAACTGCLPDAAPTGCCQ